MTGLRPRSWSICTRVTTLMSCSQNSSICRRGNEINNVYASPLAFRKEETMSTCLLSAAICIQTTDIWLDATDWLITLCQLAHAASDSARWDGTRGSVLAVRLWHFNARKRTDVLIWLQAKRQKPDCILSLFCKKGTFILQFCPQKFRQTPPSPPKLT